MKATPWVTWSLVALHLLVLVVIEWPQLDQAQRSTGPGIELPLESGAPAPAPETPRSLWTDHAYWRGDPALGALLTGIALHPGVPAALLGLLLLLIFGDNVEHHLGRRLYLILYLGGGALGTALAASMQAGEPIQPVVGSGAALGTVMGAYLIFFPRNEVRIAYTRLRPAVSDFLRSGAGAPYVPSWVAVPLCVVMMLVAGLFSIGRALDSLLPGVAIGIGAALVLKSIYRDPSREGNAAWYPNPLLVRLSPAARVAHLVREGEVGPAARLYLEIARTAASDEFEAEHLEQIAAWLEQQGMTEAAAAARRRGRRQVERSR